MSDTDFPEEVLAREYIQDKSLLLGVLHEETNDSGGTNILDLRPRYGKREMVFHLDVAVIVDHQSENVDVVRVVRLRDEGVLFPLLGE